MQKHLKVTKQPSGKTVRQRKEMSNTEEQK